MSEPLPDCAAIARELAAQPEFFEFHRDAAEIADPPSQRPSLALARYTGDRSDDEQINLRVGAMRLLGFSDRAIERECGVDRRTIPYRLSWLEKTRRIPAVKDRVAMRTGDLAERAAIVLASLLDRAAHETNADLASMIKAVGTVLGITAEKMQLLTGAATERIEHIGGGGREAIEDWMRQMGITVDVTATVTDLESGRERPVPEANPQLADRGHGWDTATGQQPDLVTIRPATEREAEQGGGGGLRAGAGAESVTG